MYVIPRRDLTYRYALAFPAVKKGAGPGPVRASSRTSAGGCMSPTLPLFHVHLDSEKVKAEFASKYKGMEAELSYRRQTSGGETNFGVGFKVSPWDIVVAITLVIIVRVVVLVFILV